MALQQQRTVKITENLADQANNNDDVVTLVKPSDANRMPVYFCESPFILENDTFCTVVDNVATLSPQPLFVVTDEKTNQITPDLSLSIQAYCHHNNQALTLGNFEIISTHVESEMLDEAGDVIVVIGSEDLLMSIVRATLNLSEKTVIYIPTTVEDQFNLHQLLEVEQHCTIAPIISIDVLETTDAHLCLTAVVKAVDLAITQDSQLVNWIESNAHMLATLNGDSLTNLLSRYLSIASENNQASLSSNDIDSVLAISRAAGDNLKHVDAMAMLIAIRIRAAVIAGNLSEGVDARVCHLLIMLGCKLHFDSLKEQAACLSQNLLESNKNTLTISIGEQSPATTPNAKHLEDAMMWLNEQYLRRTH